MIQAEVVFFFSREKKKTHYFKGRRVRHPAFLKLQMCEEGSSCLSKEHPWIGARSVGQAE